MDIFKSNFVVFRLVLFRNAPTFYTMYFATVVNNTPLVDAPLFVRYPMELWESSRASC